MTLSRIELVVERRTTEAFISADPVDLVLQYRVQASDGAGGRNVAHNPRLPQRCRVIPARTRSTSLTYTLPNGMVVSSKDSLLVGRWDMVVEDGDWFMYEGLAYQVTFIEPDRQIQTLGQLDMMGTTYRESV